MGIEFRVDEKLARHIRAGLAAQRIEVVYWKDGRWMERERFERLGGVVQDGVRCLVVGARNGQIHPPTVLREVWEQLKKA